MVQYQATPDYYNDYIAHYGVKGMKWKKRLKGKYYKTKSKLAELKARNARGSLFSNAETRDVVSDRKKQKQVTNGIVPGIRFKFGGDGKANSLSGQTGSKNVQTTKVRTGITKVENRPVARKKKIVSGTSTPRKRK